jgi:hypothetical protein
MFYRFDEADLPRAAVNPRAIRLAALRSGLGGSPPPSLRTTTRGGHGDV